MQHNLIFIDTEFTDFLSSQLISLGAITLDGKHEFYVEISDYPSKMNSEFVNKIVVPLLNPAVFGKKKVEAGASFYCWLEEMGESKLCIDYSGDWDLALDLSECFPQNIIGSIMMQNELNQQVLNFAQAASRTDFGWLFEKVQQQYNGGFLDFFHRNPHQKQHHALADARANRYAYLKVQEWIERQWY